MPAVAGLLLTGGASRRFGVDKATIVVDGERLVDRVARVLTSVAAPVLEVGIGHTALPVVREEPPGDGPLAAVAAGATALEARGSLDPVLVLAVDMPFADTALLEWLASHVAATSVVPVVDGVAQPLCARYAVDALRSAVALVRAGERSMRALLDTVPVHEAHEGEWGGAATRRTFADIDTREDAAALGLWPPG